jgi:hypothetical protein
LLVATTALIAGEAAGENVVVLSSGGGGNSTSAPLPWRRPEPFRTEYRRRNGQAHGSLLYVWATLKAGVATGEIVTVVDPVRRALLLAGGARASASAQGAELACTVAVLGGRATGDGGTRGQLLVVEQPDTVELDNDFLLAA